MLKKKETSKNFKKAVVKIGGRQYFVKPHQELTVEKLSEKQKSKAVFKDVLAVVEEDGSLKKLGQPFCDSEVHVKIIGDVKGKKINVIKYKPKTRYRKKIGHRQRLTRIKITAIVVN